MESETNGETSRTHRRYIVASLIAVCLAIYGQVLWFGFINFDDNMYVYENAVVAGGLNLASIKWAFTTFHAANWHPLTWISHMLDSSLFGGYAGGHHFTNVVFHAANSVLAFIVFRQLTGDLWKSAMVAFLFAVHPAHVESVAWVSERKDVLSTLFWLLTMLAYIRYVRTVGGESLARRMISVPYLLIVLFSVLGLISKPMLVTLPFVLLLCDYWPLRRLAGLKDLTPLVLEKLPMFVLAGASAYITILAQASYGAIQSTQVLPLGTRILNAIVSYASYLVMLVWPVNLGIGYAYEFPFPTWKVVGSILLLLFITLVCLWQARERRYLTVGWLWFLGTMVPVIGLVQVGAQSMADRYTYVPYFGLFIIAVWGLAELMPRLKLNFSSTVVAAAIPILVLAVLAFNQTSHWKNAVTLYTHTLSTGKGNFLTMHNLCSALAVQQRFAEAEVHCRNSIATDPGFADSHVLLGVVSFSLGRSDTAIAEFNKALELDPNNVMARTNMVAPLAVSGRTDEAEAALNSAKEAYRQGGMNTANLTGLYVNLAAAFAKENRFDKAERSLRQVLEFAPDRADSRANLALSLYLQNRLTEARGEVERSISQNPNQPESYNILGMILLKQGDHSGAAAQFQKALQLKPDFKEAKDNLEKANAGK